MCMCVYRYIELVLRRFIGYFDIMENLYIGHRYNMYRYIGTALILGTLV